jgi:hypothetical protein
MKTLKQVLKEQPKELHGIIEAVYEDIGKESIEDVNRHGIDGGYGSFIYYKDTIAFWIKYKKEIKIMLSNLADDLGENILTMVQNFNCLSDNRGKDRKPYYTIDEIGEVVYGCDDEQNEQIQNALAWFAAEEICRMFEN